MLQEEEVLAVAGGFYVVGAWDLLERVLVGGLVVAFEVGE